MRPMNSSYHRRKGNVGHRPDELLHVQCVAFAYISGSIFVHGTCRTSRPKRWFKNSCWKNNSKTRHESVLILQISDFNEWRYDVKWQLQSYSNTVSLRKIECSREVYEQDAAKTTGSRANWSRYRLFRSLWSIQVHDEVISNRFNKTRQATRYLIFSIQ